MIQKEKMPATKENEWMNWINNGISDKEENQGQNVISLRWIVSEKNVKIVLL